MDNQQQVYPQCKHYRNDIWICTDGSTYSTSKKKNALSTNTSGYDRLTTGESVHRVVYSLFLGEIPKDYQINHINGIKTDNRIHNLECVTVYQNRMHSIESLGNSRYGGFIPNKKKLTNEQIIEISSYLYNTNIPMINLGIMYGVSGTAIQYINYGQNYRWLTGKLFNDYPIRSRAK